MAIMDAVDRWYQANNSGDVDAILDTLTTSGTFHDPAAGGALAGDELRPFWSRWPDPCPTATSRWSRPGP